MDLVVRWVQWGQAWEVQEDQTWVLEGLVWDLEWEWETWEPTDQEWYRAWGQVWVLTAQAWVQEALGWDQEDQEWAQLVAQAWDQEGLGWDQEGQEWDQVDLAWDLE